MPVELTIPLEITVRELSEKNAVWHKSCHLKFASTKLCRVQDKVAKRKSTTALQEVRKSKRHSTERNVEIDRCVFCDEQGGDLRQVLTLEVDHDVREMAIEMTDTKIIAKISSGDMVALGSKYHTKCILAYRRKFNALKKNAENDTARNDAKESQARAFAELISYMESMAENGTYLFTLSDLYSLYCARLDELHVNINVHKTRLKNQIIEFYEGDIQEQTDGKNTVLAFNEGIKRLLKDALANRNYAAEAIALAKAAKAIRNDVFEKEIFEFNGSFQEAECQSQSIPSSLLCLVSMLINGPSIKNQDIEESQACLSIAQLIIFNMKKKLPNPKKTKRHTPDREPPLPVYLGLNIHAQTRSKKTDQPDERSWT